MKLAAVVVLSIACFALAALWLWRRDIELATYAIRVDGQLSANRRATIQFATTATQRAAPRATAGVAPASQSGAKPPLPNAARGVAVRQMLLRTPEYAPFVRKEFQQRAMAEYGDWFSQLGLPPERMRIIRQAIADRIATSQEAFDAAIAAGYRNDSREFEELIKRYEQEGDARLKEVLTEEEFASYNAYEKVKWFRVHDLPLLSDLIGERGAPPLSADQITALSAAWQNAHEWKPDSALKPGPLALAQNERVLQLIGSALGPDQHATLAEYIEYLNTKTRRMGELLRPQDPGGAVYSSNVQRD